MARLNTRGVFATAASRAPRDVRGKTLPVRFEIVDSRVSAVEQEAAREGQPPAAPPAGAPPVGPYIVSVSLRVTARASPPLLPAKLHAQKLMQVHSPPGFCRGRLCAWGAAQLDCTLDADVLVRTHLALLLLYVPQRLADSETSLWAALYFVVGRVPCQHDRKYSLCTQPGPGCDGIGVARRWA